MFRKNRTKFFDDWCELWLETYKRRTVKASTFGSYRFAAQHIDLHIPMRQLRAWHIQENLNQLADDGLALSTVKHTYTIIRQAVQAAKREGLCKKVDLSNVELVSDRALNRVHALTPDEQLKLLNHLDFSFYGPFFYFLMITGLRVGEALALTWSDVQLGNRRININKTLYRGKIQPPKTSTSFRYIPITDEVFKLLRGQFRAHERLIWTNTLGTCINYRSLLNSWHKFCSNCGISEHGLHVLRHTYATNALSAGVNSKVLCDLLGHANVSVTLGIYTDVRAEHKLAAANQIVDYLQELRLSSADNSQILDFSPLTAILPL